MRRWMPHIEINGEVFDNNRIGVYFEAVRGAVNN
jgi:hypothetical protein